MNRLVLLLHLICNYKLIFVYFKFWAEIHQALLHSFTLVNCILLRGITVNSKLLRIYCFKLKTMNYRPKINKFIDLFRWYEPNSVNNIFEISDKYFPDYSINVEKFIELYQLIIVSSIYRVYRGKFRKTISISIFTTQ